VSSALVATAVGAPTTGPFCARVLVDFKGPGVNMVCIY
jgi:hypothetical protein